MGEGTGNFRETEQIALLLKLYDFLLFFLVEHIFEFTEGFIVFLLGLGSDDFINNFSVGLLKLPDQKAGIKQMLEIILSDRLFNSFTSVGDYRFRLRAVVRLEKLVKNFGHGLLSFIKHNRESKNNDFSETVKSKQCH